MWIMKTGHGNVISKWYAGFACKSEDIVADGNCFFRPVSLAMSGAQKNHIKIR